MKEKIGFIGAGKMGEALLKGIIKQEIFSPAQIYISDINQSRLKELEREYKMNICKDNLELIEKVDIITLAVKPQVIFKVLTEVSNKVSKEQVIYSIAAGVETSEIEEYFPEVAVLRMMPNTPALVSKGAIAYCGGSYSKKEHKQLLEKIFTTVGEVVEVKEDLMDAVTGLSGSGPAYIYLIIEALLDAGVNVGLPREIARELTLQTIEGSVKMLKETGDHPAQLKDMVTSPGGTTISALESLENDGLRAALYNAVKQATNKSKRIKEDD